MIPNRVIHAKAHEPAEQQIELQPLHQLALGAHSVKRLQQHRPQQLLQCNGRTAKIPITAGKLTLQSAHCRVRNLPDRPQRMPATNPRLQIHIAEQCAGPLVGAAHLSPFNAIRTAGNHVSNRPATDFFNNLLERVRNSYSKATGCGARPRTIFTTLSHEADSRNVTILSRSSSHRRKHTARSPSQKDSSGTL